MSVVGEALDAEPLRLLLRRDYNLLVEAGAFEDEHLELLEGRLVLMSPEGAPHAAVISALTHLMVRALDGRALIRVGSPLAVSDVSEPQPDVAVIAVGEHWRDHPSTALLAVEVSHSSIRKDRVVKPGLYAAAGVVEYWIVDLNTDTVTVLSEPAGNGFAKAATMLRGQTITLIAFPDVTLAVNDFLPPR